MRGPRTHVATNVLYTVLATLDNVVVTQIINTDQNYLGEPNGSVVKLALVQGNDEWPWIVCECIWWGTIGCKGSDKIERPQTVCKSSSNMHRCIEELGKRMELACP